MDSAYQLEGDGVYMLPQYEQPACHKSCPLSVITRSVVEYDALLELYYHCKLCQAPQAYLEAETFVTHVQECHADYYQPEHARGGDVLVYAYPESKTAAAQADEEEMAQQQGELQEVEGVQEGDVQEAEVQEGEEGQGGEVPEGDIQTEEQEGEDQEGEDQEGEDQEGEEQEGEVQEGEVQEGEVQEGEVHEGEVQEEEQADTESAHEYDFAAQAPPTPQVEPQPGMPEQFPQEPCAAVKDEVLEAVQPQFKEEDNQALDQTLDQVVKVEEPTFMDEGAQEIDPNSEVNPQLQPEEAVSIGAEKGGEIELVIEWPEDGEADSEEQRVRMLEAITSRLLKQEPDSAVSAEHIRRQLEQSGIFKTEERVLEEESARLEQQFTDISSIATPSDDSQEDIKPLLPGSQQPVHSRYLMSQQHEQQHEQQVDVKPDVTTPQQECRVCRARYTRWHVTGCVRPHDTEKPSCDAFVCVAESSEKVYPCRFCDNERIFLCEEALRTHMGEEHVPELKLECDLCGKRFSKDFKLLSHLMRCQGAPIYKCPLCGKTFTHKQNYMRHRELHTGVKHHMCEVCGKAFFTKASLIIHFRNHTGEKPFTCAHCDAAFKTQSHLMRHSWTHSDTKKYMCDTCGKGFVDKSGLHRHMLKHEGKEIRLEFPCSTCGKILASKRQRIEHERTYHMDLSRDQLNKFECDLCRKKFRTKRNMQIHRMIHTGVKPFTCKTCGKGFYKNSDLTLHMRVHTGDKPHKCNMCPRAFANASNLTKHKIIHSNARPFGCKICGKRFNDPSHLSRHNKIHTGEKPFPCPTCDRPFATKQQMQMHMLVHSSVQPFMCGACGKTFRQKAKAKKHICPWSAGRGGQLEYQLNEGHRLVVEEADQEFAEHIAIEQSEEGERLIVKVLEEAGQEAAGYGDQIAVQVVDEHGHRISEQVAYQLVEQGGGEHVTVRLDNAPHS